MTRSLSSAILVAALALGAPVATSAQHSQPAGTPSVGTASPAGGGGSSGGSSGGGSTSSSSGGGSSAGTFAVDAPTSPSGRRRGGIPASDTAVPRGSVPGNGGTIVITEGSGFYPWGWGYYGGVGAIVGGYYGNYYGAYDPWYGWFPTYAPVFTSYGGSDDTGSLRLKVKPADASVYVDGFYVGIVDDFDGSFQRLRLDRGPHRIEMRAPGHEPIAVDVMIQEDFTITYRGELPRQ